jgi:SAM-dependent methyltransferase
MAHTSPHSAPPRSRARWLVLCLGAGAFVASLRAAPPADVGYGVAKPFFETLREEVWPAPVRGRSAAEIEAAWPAWVRARDAEIRSRVADGDSDSVVHLLLFGTSFTKAPRASSRELAALVSDPPGALAALAARIDDFVAAVVSPGSNARMTLVREVVAREGIDVDSTNGRTSLRRHLEQRALALGRAGADQLAAMVGQPGSVSTIFRERGLSTDTTLSVDFGLDRALEALKAGAVLGEDSVRRVAIIGPGLDFIDKQNGYDFYAQQTIQPFALVDSLRRTSLARSAGLQVVAFDLSPRVLRHLEDARTRARAKRPYLVVLPRSLERPSTPGFVGYWERFGDRIGEPAGAPVVPPTAGRVAVRAVTVRPDVVLAVEARDLNVVLQREDVAAEGGFDLVVATNVLLYYDVFEQSLAMANIAALLRPGGLLLTNTRLIELPGVPMVSVGYTDSVYTSLPSLGDAGDRIWWYRKP